MHAQNRPAPIMLEILPIILSKISQKFCPLSLPIILIKYVVILELDDCSIRVYRSFAEHIQ